MKRKLLSIIIGFTIINYAMAGGNIQLTQIPTINEEPYITNSSLYFGIGYGNTIHEHDIYSVDLGTTQNAFDENFHSFLVQIGYEINSYFAIEGRYWFGFDNDFAIRNLRPVESSINIWAIYLKPTYPITEVFNIYALLGYAGVQHDVNGNPAIPDALFEDNYTGFSWGVGATYTLNENVSIFIDYVDIYDDKKSWIHPVGGWAKVSDEKIDMWSIGISYKF